MSTFPTGRDEITDSEQVSQALARFERLAITDGGWSALHRDPEDGRLWELTFPEGHLHGGGPPLLRIISRREASEKYGVTVDGGEGGKAATGAAR